MPFLQKQRRAHAASGEDAQKNEDISKNAALIPPGFGTPTSNTLNTGEYLTPDLVPSAMPATGATVNGDFVVVFPPDMTGLVSSKWPAPRFRVAASVPSKMSTVRPMAGISSVPREPFL